jgi:hypothetical protein
MVEEPNLLFTDRDDSVMSSSEASSPQSHFGGALNRKPRQSFMGLQRLRKESNPLGIDAPDTVSSSGAGIPDYHSQIQSPAAFTS